MKRIYWAGIASFACYASIGCSTATLTPAAETDAGPPACASDPQLACDASAPTPAPSTCLADPSASGWAGRIPTDAGYPIGCAAYFVGPDCSNLGRCLCLMDADAGRAAWSCPQ